MNFLAVAEMGNGAKIFLTLLALVGMGGLIALLIYSVLRERNKWIEEKKSYIEGVLSKSEITSTIDNYITKNVMNSPFGLIMIDLDKYSQFINAFNEKVAREVVSKICSKIIKILPFQTPLGALSDDKFVILFRNTEEADDISHIAQKLRELIKEPIKINIDTEVSITASVAIGYFPRHGHTASQLLESLGLCVYTIKKDGGDKVRIYSDDMSEKESENIQYYTQVTEGIKNKEFFLTYQPIVDVRLKQVVGIEGLLRWQHPVHGEINPVDFLHILEQSGDIYWIGVWSLEEAIRQYNNIKTTYPSKNVKITLNLSPKQLSHEKLAADFAKIIKKYKMIASDIVIELEEFIIFEQHSEIKQNIMKLRDIGFEFAVDGFALDHKTLQKIENLPIDYLKIKMTSFDEDNKDNIKTELDNLLFRYAEEKSIKIVAERIENYEDSKLMNEKGIYLNQGYYFAKPLKEDELLSVIGDDKRIEELCDGTYVEPIKPVEEEIIPEEIVDQPMPAKTSKLRDKFKKAKKDKKPKDEASIDVAEEVQAEEPVEEVQEEPKEEQPVEEVHEEAKEEQPVEEVAEAKPTEEIEAPTEEKAEEVVEQEATTKQEDASVEPTEESNEENKADIEPNDKPVKAKKEKKAKKAKKQELPKDEESSDVAINDETKEEPLEQKTNQ